MTGGGRIFFDITYTRTQSGNVGITRTVRRLLAALPGALGDTWHQCIPVAFHTEGYRLAGAAGQGVPSEGTPKPARAYRWMTGSALRLVPSALLPGALLRGAWAWANRWTFDALSRREAPVHFEPHDVLVIADEAWNYPAWQGAQAARRAGARTVLVVYDLIPLRHPEYCDPLFCKVFAAWLPRMLGASDAVACISRATEEDLRAWCANQGIACPPTTHFRLGSDIPAPPRAAQDRIAAFLAAGAPCFAAVGTIEPRKNHELLLDVFEQLWHESVPARLVVAGRAHPKSLAVVRRMQKHPQQGRQLLTLLDANDAEIRSLYAGARALVFPSMAEGFGLPVVEARVLGCPVIASRLPSVVELADEGVDLFVAGGKDELRQLLLKHLQQDRRLGRTPMPLVSWDGSAGQLLAGVRGLLRPAFTRDD